MVKPIVALTMGDAAGIGPELIAKAFADPQTGELCRPFVIGDPRVMRQAVGCVGTAHEVREVSNLAQARFDRSLIEVFRPAELSLGEVRTGALDPTCGRAAAICLAKAFELALAGEVQGVVSAPLNKQALHLAGYDYRDELAYVADLTQSPETYVLGAVSAALWTISVTEHVPFSAIAGMITREKILQGAHRLHRALVGVGLSRPRLAVAALNPHGGEGGLLGREEVDEITPAIDQARLEGLDVTGPHPADTVFVRAREGDFDGIVCLYHDQANIARKLLAIRTGATLFMGLPVVCGTTAHGTAFDKAGLGIADPGSLMDALRYTSLLAAQSLEVSESLEDAE
jgi:4-phospho-D-threonate 3-dehydrogenase / 4-phospho-D-erythronate 3-dehydrogenase